MPREIKFSRVERISMWNFKLEPAGVFVCGNTSFFRRFGLCEWDFVLSQLAHFWRGVLERTDENVMKIEEFVLIWNLVWNLLNLPLKELH